MRKYILVLLAILALGIVGSVWGATYINSLPYTINQSGYYILNTSCTDLNITAIIIDADNVVLDGNGKVLDGNNTYWKFGIYVYNHKNITIKNLVVKEFWNGIYLWSSSYNTITDCNISDCYDGICLDSSSNNIINNTFENCGLVVYSYNNVVINNTVNGKPLVYLENEKDKIIDNAGQVIVVNCSNITVKDVSLSDTYCGIEFLKVSNSKIIDCSISDCFFGIALGGSFNTITDCNILDCLFGVYLDYSSNTTITDCNISDCLSGIAFDYSSSNTITDCSISNCYDGIHLEDSSNNNIIYLNNFINNSESVYIYNSGGNIFYSPIPINYTYNGKTFVNYLGNYYSEYNGTDSDGDGIGDTPYGDDKYPLIKPVENYIINSVTSFSVILPNATVRVNKTAIFPILLNTLEPLGSLQFKIYYNPEIINITKVKSNVGMTQTNIGYGFVEVGIINTSGFSSGEIAEIIVVGLSNGTTILDGELIDASDVEGNKKYGSIIPGEIKVVARKKGDANGDDKITAVDALIYLRFAVGLDITPYKLDPVADDMTGDGRITVTDALKVLRIAVGLE